MNDKHAKRRQSGVCPYCGNLPLPGKSRCGSCIDVATAAQARLKLQTFAAYGGACECCGETTVAFLTIDHINDDGSAHRRELEKTTMYRWLKRHGYPKDGYRLLCFNCNCGRRVNGGVCPHKAALDGIHSSPADPGAAPDPTGM
jgi:hypothetical protein